MSGYQEPTEEELQELMALDKQVYESGAGALTPKQRISKVFVDHGYEAALSIIALAKAASNDNTRFRAAQYVIDRVLGTVKADDTKLDGKGETDPLEDMVKVFTEAQKDDNR
jgi:hypothetical protein